MHRFFRILPTLILILFFQNSSLYSQDLDGTWQGRIFFWGQQIRIVFHFKQDSTHAYTATMDSPDQGVTGDPVDDIEWSDDSLSLFLPEIDGEFNGKLKKDTAIIAGYFKQNGIRLPLKLLKGEDEGLLYKRPQRPVRPFPYHEEEVTIMNKNGGDTLAGSFTKPNSPGKFPVAVMITGSGPEDRDETVFGHKPFLVLADFLTKKGFAVLRCDDRGTAKSTGNFKSATPPDFASDVEAQVDYLKSRSDVDPKRIGLIGHSEGGIIAPMVAAKRKDIAYVVLMAGPGIDMFELLLIQDSLIATAEGSTPSEIRKSVSTNKSLYNIMRITKDSASAADSIDQYLSGIKSSDREILQAIRQLCNPWMRWYMGFDPRVNLGKLNCAVLALNGEKDYQVPAEIDIASIEQTLKSSGHKNYETIILPGLNHLFQHCNKCSVSEYIQLEQTMDPAALDVIGNWMEKNILKK